MQEKQMIECASVHARIGSTTLIDCTRAQGGPINGIYKEILTIEKGAAGEKFTRNVTTEGAVEYAYTPDAWHTKRLTGREDRYMRSQNDNGLVTTRIDIGQLQYMDPALQHLTDEHIDYKTVRANKGDTTYVNRTRQLVLESTINIDETARPNTYVITQGGGREYLTPQLQTKLEKLVPGLDLNQITRIDPHAKFEQEARYALQRAEAGDIHERGDPGSSLKNHAPAHKIKGVLKTALKPGPFADAPSDVVQPPARDVAKS